MKTPIELKNKREIIDADKLVTVWYPQEVTEPFKGENICMLLEFSTDNSIYLDHLYYDSMESAVEDYQQLVDTFFI